MSRTARTNELRDAVKTKLDTLKTEFGIKEVYYRYAAPEAMYPHICFDLSGSNDLDFNRHDYSLDIEIDTKDEALCQNIADAIEDEFNNLNSPSSDILPTFFLETRNEIEDTDKTIRRIVVRLVAQVYES